MNDEFELPGDSYSVSDIQNCIKYIIWKHETLTTIPPINVYVVRINNRLVFKVKDGHHLLQHIKTTIAYRTKFFKNCFQKSSP